MEPTQRDRDFNLETINRLLAGKSDLELMIESNDCALQAQWGEHDEPKRAHRLRRRARVIADSLRRRTELRERLSRVEVETEQ